MSYIVEFPDSGLSLSLWSAAFTANFFNEFSILPCAYFPRL